MQALKDTAALVRFARLLTASSIGRRARTYLQCLTQWSHQSQASQGVEGSEHGAKSFDPHRDGAISFCCVQRLRETPGLYQDDMLHSECQTQCKNVWISVLGAQWGDQQLNTRLVSAGTQSKMCLSVFPSIMS